MLCLVKVRRLGKLDIQCVALEPLINKHSQGDMYQLPHNRSHKPLCSRHLSNGQSACPIIIVCIIQKFHWIINQAVAVCFLLPWYTSTSCCLSRPFGRFVNCSGATQRCFSGQSLVLSRSGMSSTTTFTVWPTCWLVWRVIRCVLLRIESFVCTTSLYCIAL